MAIIENVKGYAENVKGYAKWVYKGITNNDVLGAAKNYGKSLGELGSGASSGVDGFFNGVGSIAVGVTKFFGGIAAWFGTKALNVSAGLNRNPITGKLIGLGILTGAVYGVYKGLKYAMGYRDEGAEMDAVSAERQLERERARGAMLNAHLEQAVAQDPMYRNQGNWAASVGGPQTSPYQQQVTEPSVPSTAKNR